MYFVRRRNSTALAATGYYDCPVHLTALLRVGSISTYTVLAIVQLNGLQLLAQRSIVRPDTRTGIIGRTYIYIYQKISTVATTKIGRLGYSLIL